MAANESTKLLLDSEKGSASSAENKPKSKMVLLICGITVLSIGMFASVMATTGSGTNTEDVQSTSNTVNLKDSETAKPVKQKRCQIPEATLNEILSLQGVADRVMNHVLNGTGKGSTWNKLAEFTDKFGHRLAGSQALEDSIDFMIDSLKRDGLENVHGEEAKVPHWVRGQESAIMVEPRRQELVMLGLGDSVGTPPEGITAEVLVVRSYFELSQKSAQDVQGKIVVYNQNYEGYSRGTKYRRQGAVEAAKKGAVASLIRSITPYSISSPHTGWQDYDANVTKIPTACITVENAEMLDRITKRGEKVVVELKMEAKSLPYVTSRNVIAEIKGSKYPEQIVMVSGHIDSWDVGQGAQDDGGGAFISTEALNIIHTLGLRPKRTLRAILWTGEETGTHGARQYAADHQDETENWSLVMESDEGTFKPTGLTFTGQNEVSQCIMLELMKLLKPIRADRLVVSQSSAPDIEQWTNMGIPGGALLSKNGQYFNYHHAEADTMTHVDSHELDLCTVLWTIVSYVVADLEDKLPR